jgi:hypothetical protein
MAKAYVVSDVAGKAGYFLFACAALTFVAMLLLTTIHP